MSDVAARIAALSPERRALVERLLASDGARPAVGRGPRDAAESALCAIWREVLGVDVSIDDNYFERGGDSILAVSIVAKARAAGVPMTLDQLLRTPTIAALAAQAAALPRVERAAAPVPPPSVEPVEFPLTPLQQGLLLGALERPGSGVYVSQFCCRLTGPLDVQLFEESWNEAIERHAALRMCISNDEWGAPRQRVAPAARMGVATQDWTGMAAARRPAALEALLDADRRQSFDLAAPPLMRLMLVRTEVDTHWCVWTHHHLLLDGWSQHVLLSDVFEIYAARRGGHAADRRPSPSFGGYVRWLAEQDLEAPEAFWGRYLARGAAAPPTAGRRATGAGSPSPAPDTHVELVEGRDAAALDAASRLQHVPSSTLLYAAWALLDATLRGVEDVVFGTTVTVRPPELAGSDRLVGLCINTVPMRVRCAQDATVGEWIQALHIGQVEWSRHVHAPLPAIARWSGASSATLFETLVVIENLPSIFVEPPAASGLRLENVRFTVREEYPLVVVFTPGATLRVELKYDPARWTRAQIQRAGRLLRRALEVVTHDRSISLKAAIENLRAAKRADEDADERAARDQDLDRLRAGLGRGGTAGRRPVTVVEADLVTVGPLHAEQELPVLVVPRRADVDLLAWVRGNISRVEDLRLRHGAVLFRGFSSASAGGPLALVRDVVSAVGGEPMAYVERSSPRREVGPRVYTSTEYPADQTIPLHNENSYAHAWPQQLAFLCVEAPGEGGQTPLADCRQVLRLLPSDVVERFRAAHVRYVRNYRDDLGLPWQTVFGTTSRADVETRCREHGYEVDWKTDGGLRTRRVAPAVVRHPRTGDEVWFNHLAFFHVTSMDPATREALLAQYGEDDLPHQTSYGDGTPIEPEVLSAIRTAYARATVRFDWARGDLLLVDNMLVAHGRAPFRGARQILVAMADPATAAALDGA